MENNNKKFDVIEFTYSSFEEGIKANESEIKKMSPFVSCIFGHKVETEFHGSPLITKVIYIREFDCNECKKVIKDINDVVDTWIPYNKPFNMKHHCSFMLKEPNDQKL